MAGARVVPVRILICATALAAAAFACTDDPAPTPAQSPTPSPTFACANQQETIEDTGLLIGEPVEDDVDGDGGEDRIAIHMDPDGVGDCRTFLTVGTGGHTLSTPAWLVGPQGGLPHPRVTAVVDIDGDGTDEIVLDEAIGASTQFVGVYAISDGQLVRLRSREPQGLFPYGGSVGHIEAVGCAGGGTIVVSMAVPAPNSDVSAQIYKVTRRSFTIGDGRLEDEKTEHHRISIHELDRFPEYESSPFGNCDPN